MLDHHHPTAIARQLRLRGRDVDTAVERDWHREPDEVLLTLCVGEQRTLLTNNVGDFMAIVRNWAVSGQHYAGLIFTSDASLPRTHAAIGMYVQLLDALLNDHPDPDEFVDRIHWLGPATPVDSP
ncbi:MAG TPA: DUF5615 family PIN-like protein [Streptosporangiaceae bacterium]|nr:DUF5615 family PIN-like protein [Streptosporangiaceae bacterium]